MYSRNPSILATLQRGQETNMEPESEPKPTAIEFAKTKLSINPDASFAEIKAQAKIEGLVVYPVVYGRAKALLGLVPTAPYGSKSKARKAAKLQKAAPSPAPTPATVTETSRMTTSPTNGSSSRTTRARAGAIAAEGSSLSSLDSMISDLKNVVQERDCYRATLEKIAQMIQHELSR